jgi:hypothetical protein
MGNVTHEMDGKVGVVTLAKLDDPLIEDVLATHITASMAAIYCPAISSVRVLYFRSKPS